ncbi:Divergent AAA domain protein [Symmachiella dynata]|uniref:Divergent AAA domain protein n=1 Tax=Symmachiella dynata TaxID=2527995 RepID=A0A517ZY52_9PLAN|nr:RNA-binding domain-containing protein [Symmachiella dynata]QDU47376.1 Divergent AAA domain protein [Symmachiella dynata]
MNLEQLQRMLDGHEWDDVEFKEARRAVPDKIYRSVSAFSNTAGGWVVFGVKDDDGNLSVVGVVTVDRVQNDFITALRSANKMSRRIELEAELLDHEDGTVLAFYIPEVSRDDKPVHLKGDWRESYIRRGASDLKCSEEELRRFIRDAAQERPDGDIVELPPDRCFDDDALKWYRREFDKRKTGHEDKSQVEFLHEWGLVVEKDGQLKPTVASILLFGTGAALRQVLPRPIVDVQWIDAECDEEQPDERWYDRIVVEENLIKSWKELIEGYRKNSPEKFEIDPDTLQRTNATPDYITFREAAINVLLHQDYADHARKPSIKFYRDVWVFSNPGDAFSTDEELLQPGDKPVRNPLIVNAFRRIGLSEQAGTGLREILKSWRQLGFDRPKINNDKADKKFELTTPRWELVTDEQLVMQAMLGVDLNEHEASAFALAIRSGELDLLGVKTVTGLLTTDAEQIMNRLVVQRLVTPTREGEVKHVLLAEHLRERFSKDDAGVLSEEQWSVIDLCDVPQSLTNLIDVMNVETSRQQFRRRQIAPLLDSGILKLTQPDTPSHPNQKYVLTIIGVDLKARRLNRKKEGG